MMKRKGVSRFLAGMLCGAVIFGGGAAYAASVIASPSTHHVTVDGVPVSVEAYNIDGNNYFQLRDLARLVGFNVTWDNATRTVEIDTDAGYSEAGRFAAAMCTLKLEHNGPFDRTAAEAEALVRGERRG